MQGGDGGRAEFRTGMQSWICTVPAARRRGVAGQPRMLSLTFPRIVGLLCAGLGLPRGHGEAADMHSSRFFVPRALLVSASISF